MNSSRRPSRGAWPRIRIPGCAQCMRNSNRQRGAARLWEQAVALGPSRPAVRQCPSDLHAQRNARRGLARNSCSRNGSDPGQVRGSARVRSRRRVELSVLPPMAILEKEDFHQISSIALVALPSASGRGSSTADGCCRTRAPSNQRSLSKGPRLSATGTSLTPSIRWKRAEG